MFVDGQWMITVYGDAITPIFARSPTLQLIAEGVETRRNAWLEQAGVNVAQSASRCRPVPAGYL